MFFLTFVRTLPFMWFHRFTPSGFGFVDISTGVVLRVGVKQLIHIHQKSFPKQTLFFAHITTYTSFFRPLFIPLNMKLGLSEVLKLFIVHFETKSNEYFILLLRSHRPCTFVLR